MRRDLDAHSAALGEGNASGEFLPGKFHGVSENLHAPPFFGQILSRPAGMLRAEKIALRVGHQAEDSPGGIADSCDAAN